MVRHRLQGGQRHHPFAFVAFGDESGDPPLVADRDRQGSRLGRRPCLKVAFSSFAEITNQEGKVERHVRFLAPLAFVSLQIISAIIDRSALADLMVTELAKAAAHYWAKQRRWVGL